jgi:hypothetical protein
MGILTNYKKISITKKIIAGTAIAAGILMYPPDSPKYEIGPKEVIIDAVKNNPDAALEYAEEYAAYTDKHTAKEFLLKAAKERGSSAVADYQYYKELPYAQEILSTGMEQIKNSPELLLKYADIYRILPNSENIFESAVDQARSLNEDWIILKYADNFKDYSNSEELVQETATQEVANGHYREFLANMPDYNKHPWVHDLAIEVANNDPLMFITYANKIKDFPDSEIIIQQIFEKFTPDSYYVNQNYGILMGYYSNYKMYNNADKILELSLTKALDLRGEESILYTSKGFVSEPWTYGYIEKAAENDPDDAIVYFNNYKDMPKAENILKNAVEATVGTADSGDIIKYSEEIMQFQWGYGYLAESAEKNPELALIYYKDYSSSEGSEIILKKAAEICAEQHSNAILENIAYFAEKNWAVNLIQIATNNNPDEGLKIAALTKFYTLKKEYLPIIKSAAEKSSPAFILNYLNECNGIGNTEWFSKLTKNAVEADPYDGLAFYNNYKKLPDSQEWFLEAAQKVAEQKPSSILDANVSENLLYSSRGRIILQTAVNNPNMIDTKMLLNDFWIWDILDNKQKVIENAILNNPIESILILQGNESTQSVKLQRIIQNSVSPNIIALSKINFADSDSSIIKVNKKISVLLINTPDLSYDDAIKIIENNDKFINSLVNLKYEDNSYGKEDINSLLSKEVLKKIQLLNSLHESPDAIRFKSVENASEFELYTLMTYGGEDAYTSTYDGLFNIFINKLKSDKESPRDLLEGVKYDKFRTFIRLSTEYNRLGDFLKLSDPIFSQEILKKFAESIDNKNGELSEAVAIADTFVATNDPVFRRILQESIQTEYDKVQLSDDKKAKIVYGLLQGMFGDGAGMDKKWISEIVSKYNLPNIINVPSSKLYNSDNINAQEYFFYPDTDGKASFAEFISEYKNRELWRIRDYGEYIQVTSINNNLRKIEIFANKPETGEKGIMAVENALKENNLDASVIVHRGHSYYANITIEHIPKTAMIVSLGSCGGYNNIEAVLKKAPEASIISTKGKGTMRVNDPLLKMLNEQIASGNDIDWFYFWKNAEKKLGRNSDFKDYVPPYLNLSTLFFRAYDKLNAQNELIAVKR